ncbi:MAG: hypothetical protein LBT60_01315 [Oscillospiraceae bacterium]|nr:hypothetical protein [Oscillospiraceae bacterium]
MSAGTSPKKNSSAAGLPTCSPPGGGRDFGIDACWYNPCGLEAPSDCAPTYQIRTLREVLTLVVA